jgi:hypothetical protein
VAAAPEAPVRATPAARPVGEGISLGDIAAAKDLIERVGADGLRALIDVLAR